MLRCYKIRLFNRQADGLKILLLTLHLVELFKLYLSHLLYLRQLFLSVRIHLLKLVLWRAKGQSIWLLVFRWGSLYIGCGHIWQAFISTTRFPLVETFVVLSLKIISMLMPMIIIFGLLCILRFPFPAQTTIELFLFALLILHLKIN